MSNKPVEIGQRVHSILYGGRNGVVVGILGEQAPQSVRSIANGIGRAGGNATLEVVYDNGARSTIPETILHGVQWRIYDEVVSREEVERRVRLAKEFEQRKEREAQAAKLEFDQAVAALREAHPQLRQGEGHEWRGAKLVAANLRKELKTRFPGVKFSVRKQGHSCVRVTWEPTGQEGVPGIKEIKALAAKYEKGRFNGMTDCYDYHRTPWNEVFGGVEYLFVDAP